MGMDGGGAARAGRQRGGEMAPGGLLMEITSRPQPREATGDTAGGARPPRIAGLILAAGRSTRMGALNKLTEEIAGKPLDDAFRGHREVAREAGEDV